MSDLGPLLQDALTDALTSLTGLMPLQVTLAIHVDPVVTEDGLVWSVPLGTITLDDRKVIDFIPQKGPAGD